MKKAFLFFAFVSMAFLSIAQSKEDQLKNILKSHTAQDTFRVNRLNGLAANTDLPSEERGKYADEALAISDKIKYTLGRGNALALLGTIKFNEGKLGESKKMFLEADTIAKKTGDAELQAILLMRSSDLLKNIDEQIHQLHQADSLAKRTNNYGLRATVLLHLAYITSDIKKEEVLCLQADSLAKITGDLEMQAQILSYLGSTIASRGNNKGLSYLFQAEELIRKSGNKVRLCSIQLSTGDIYQIYLSNYVKAMEYYLKGLHTAEGTNDPKSLITAWTDLGSLYALMGDQATALTYLLKAENANKKLGNRTLEGNLQNSIGERYRLSKHYPEAIAAYNKSITLTSDPAYIYVIQSNLADVYTRMGNLPLAFQFGFISLKAAKNFNDIAALSWIDGILSRAYLKKNMPDSAIYYATDGLAAAKQSGTIELMRDNTLALSNAYAFKKDFEKAYSNRLLYINYRDSMMNEEVRNRTAVQQYTFSLDKKQSQITTLNNQKNYQRNLLIGALVLLFLILVSAVLLLRNNRQKQKANKLLHKQKQEIDEKAKELSEQKENVELLSEIGRKITSTLSVEKIISTVYDNVNSLMDANVFGIGIYNEPLKRIDFPSTYENGEQLPFYTNSLDDKNRFGSVCFNGGNEIIINDLDKEYKNHIQEVVTVDKSGEPLSLIYLPLVAKEEKLGVITVQSFSKNAYSDYQLFMLRNIATYAAIAIENAESYETLDKTLSTLKSTQSQLIQSEKMASLGELTAGIAHEIQNPLNFVNNFSEVNKELIDELKTELATGNNQQAIEIANDIKENSEKINHHGKRADTIVKGMLQHSRVSTGQKEPTDINALADEYFRLAYHGLRAKDKSFNAAMKTDYDENVGNTSIIPQDIGRVILNLITNAFYAVDEKKTLRQAQDDKSYEPTVSVSTKKVNARPDDPVGRGNVEIRVADNGNGIPENIVDKIFHPFFTTKPTGKGTGLGLSLSYDIVKAHSGEIKVETKEGEGTEFIIQLPIV